MVGSRIAAWRKARQLPQRSLADAAGVTVSAVSWWESGRSAPSQKHLEAVVTALGISMEQFYGRVPEKNEDS